MMLSNSLSVILEETYFGNEKSAMMKVLMGRKLGTCYQSTGLEGICRSFKSYFHTESLTKPRFIYNGWLKFSSPHPDGIKLMSLVRYRWRAGFSSRLT